MPGLIRTLLPLDVLTVQVDPDVAGEPLVEDQHVAAGIDFDARPL